MNRRNTQRPIHTWRLPVSETEQEQEHIAIMASPTPNPDSLKFTVDRAVLDEGSAFFSSPEEGEESPLAKRIFELGNITSLFIIDRMITANKTSDANWADLARPIGAAIREHIHSGEAAVSQAISDKGDRTETEEKIETVLAEIRPYVQGDGGDIVFAGYQDGVVQVYMQGACSGCPSSTMTLRMGIEQRLKELQ